MRTRTLVLTLFGVFCALLVAGSISMQSLQNQKIPELSYGETALKPEVLPPFMPAQLFFVGDVMLGRRVETLSDVHGVMYPFLSALSTLAHNDLTIGNLEGPIPSDHIHTPDLGYRFSFRERVLPALAVSGFDILSLANNHTRDHGQEGFEDTQYICAEVHLTCIGDPDTVDSSSLHIETVGSTRIGFIMIHATKTYPDAEQLRVLLTALRDATDLQVAYIHWGDEYALVHNKSQEAFAHILIDEGIDAVIGHHPHVIQDIGIYNGKPIFYSLGNFIFDQYFSADVQEELGVRMVVQEDTVTYTLVPFESTTTRSQPALQSDEARAKLVGRILARVKDEPGVDMQTGELTIPREVSF